MYYELRRNLRFFYNTTNSTYGFVYIYWFEISYRCNYKHYNALCKMFTAVGGSSSINLERIKRCYINYIWAMMYVLNVHVIIEHFIEALTINRVSYRSKNIGIIKKYVIEKFKTFALHNNDSWYAFQVLAPTYKSSSIILEPYTLSQDLFTKQ